MIGEQSAGGEEGKVLFHTNNFGSPLHQGRIMLLQPQQLAQGGHRENGGAGVVIDVFAGICMLELRSFSFASFVSPCDQVRNGVVVLIKEEQTVHGATQTYGADGAAGLAGCDDFFESIEDSRNNCSSLLFGVARLRGEQGIGPAGSVYSLKVFVGSDHFGASRTNINTDV